MKKVLMILPALLCAACERESDINLLCIENVDAVQVYDIVEFPEGKYGLAYACNIRDIETKDCKGAPIVISAEQIPDVKINQMIKAPKDSCFYFPSETMMYRRTEDGQIQNFGPLMKLTSKYKINSRKGYEYWYTFAYDKCLIEHSNETKYNSKDLCICIVNDIMEKILDIYTNEQYDLETEKLYSKSVEKCKTTPNDALKNMQKKTYNRKIAKDIPQKTIEGQADNNENPSCVNDIHSVQVLAKGTKGDSDFFAGVICRDKVGDRSFCLGEYVIIYGKAFDNVQEWQRLMPSNDQCFMYYGNTNSYRIVNGKRQPVKILGQGTKYSIFTEKGYQYRYNKTYNGCIQEAKKSEKYNKEADNLMCECQAGFITDIVRDLAKIENKTIKHLLEKIVAWRFYKGLDYQCGPGTEVFQKVKELRNPE